MNSETRWAGTIIVFLVMVIIVGTAQTCSKPATAALRPADYRTVIAEDDWSITYRITTYRKTLFDDWIPKESVLTIQKGR